MRAILDTNILCSALLTPGGPTDRLYRAWREGRFELLTSEDQLEEFRRVTRYPRLKPFIVDRITLANQTEDTSCSNPP